MQSRFALVSRGLPLLGLALLGASFAACTGDDPEPCTGPGCDGTAAGPDGGPTATAGFELTSGASITLIQGASVDVDVSVTRSAFDGPITVGVTGAPAGVIPSPLVIPAGATAAKLTLSALASAAQGPTPIMLTASSADGAIHRERTATLLVRGVAGGTDTTFGTGTGRILANIGTTGIGVQSTVVQADGRVLVGGQSDNDFVAVRLAEGGALDTTYGGSGVVTVDLKTTGMASVDTATCMALTTTGQAVLGGFRANGGENTYGVARLTTAGAPDTTFNASGYATPSFVPAGANSELGFGIAVQPDGRVLLAGSVTTTPAGKSAAIVARFKTNGALDDSFGVGASGFFSGHSGADTADSCEAVSVLSDGKIIAACSTDGSAGGGAPFPVALRLLASGLPDTAFGPAKSGYSTVPLQGASAHNLHRLADGRFLLTGETADGKLFVARLQSDGTVDSAFGPNGIVLVTLGAKVSGGRSALDAAERVTFAAGLGDDGDLVVVRLDAAGKLDTSFGGTGFVVEKAGTKAVAANARVAIAPDGRIVAATNLATAPSQLLAVRLWP